MFVHFARVATFYDFFDLYTGPSDKAAAANVDGTVGRPGTVGKASAAGKDVGERQVIKMNNKIVNLKCQMFANKAWVVVKIAVLYPTSINPSKGTTLGGQPLPNKMSAVST